ncbi:hypothetical protein K432DRAFT_313201, partial [Lepidopterella palustris CBS 459.81]
TLTLKVDNSIISTGTGNKWRTIYAFLPPHGPRTEGRRVSRLSGDSWIPSLGGFLSQSRRISASWLMVEATVTNPFYLFWALLGVYIFFVLLHEFDASTLSSPEVGAKILNQAALRRPSTSMLQRVYNFGKYGSLDLKAVTVLAIFAFTSLDHTAYSTGPSTP